MDLAEQARHIRQQVACRRGQQPFAPALAAQVRSHVEARRAAGDSFAEARKTLGAFTPTPPSVQVLEHAVLGLGQHTFAWFEQAEPPKGDGEVLVIEIDCKGAPTATESELARRRGKRKHWAKRCRRHRGRERRARYPKKPRRKKGDKSKNAKMATLVVLFTLRRGQDGKLHGPLNVRYYASFAPKRHAFAIAKREAAKRGFGPETKRRVQLATDGDNDLAEYAQEYLPQALHSIDVMHVVEKLWRAGESLYAEGSPACARWVKARKDELYAGRAEQIVAHLERQLSQTPKTGPGNKGKRERLSEVIGYLAKRVTRLRYDLLLAEDLELGTGMVEGAVKNLIGKRCDHGGMRWIKERVEAMVQLRCIEANGDFERFVEFAHQRLRQRAIGRGRIACLLSAQAAPLPTFGIAA